MRRKTNGRARRPLQPTVGNFRDDPMFPRIERAVIDLLAVGKIIRPIDVLVGMGLLDPRKLEAWETGKVPYLERVIDCNLTRLMRLLRILRFYAHDLNLVPTACIHHPTTKGSRKQLRFTKTGAPRLEEAYARHFVWPGKGPFHMPEPRKVEIEAPSYGLDFSQLNI